MIYMNQEKEMVDAEWKKNHKKKDTSNKGNCDRPSVYGGVRGGQFQKDGCGRGGSRDGSRDSGQRQVCGYSKRCQQNQGEHLWRESPSNFNSLVGRTGLGRGRDGKGCGREYESYHTNRYH